MPFFLYFIFYIQIYISLTYKEKIDDDLIKKIQTTATFMLISNLKNESKIFSNKQPKVSIVIPVYNEEKNIKSIINSIKFQTLKEVEILFIDDNSTDESNKIISKYQKTDERVKLIKNKSNRGILYNRIYGGLQAKGEYITFIDADDFYINLKTLQFSYEICTQNNLDFLEFNYYVCDLDKDLKTISEGYLYKKENKTIYYQVYHQPYIKNSFFHYEEKGDKIEEVVFNKLYSHRQIEKMAEYIGEDIWNQHYLYKEDFLMNLALARTAESSMLLSFSGVFHWKNNNDSMSYGIFDLDGSKLKNPDNTNKKFGDIISILENCFNLNEEESDSEPLFLKMLQLLKNIDNMDILSKSYHFERIFELCRKIYLWKFLSEKGKKVIEKFMKEIIGFDIPKKLKYSEFFDKEEDLEDKNKERNIQENLYKNKSEKGKKRKS